MTACDQLPAATDEPTLRVVYANQRRDFHCRSDVYLVPAREPASLGTSHEPARLYNRRVRQTLQITFL